MVVVPRGGSWGARVAAAAAARGLDPRIVPLVTDAPPLDAGPLDRMVARLAAGRPAPAPGAGRPAPVPEFRNLEASGSDIVEPRRPARGESSHLDGAGAGRAGDDWLVVTSATTVRVLAERLPGLPAGVRVAAVGEVTARAARAVGWTVDLVPDDHSAAGLVRALPADARLVLHPRSDLAAPTLVDGLRARGIDVSEVVAYRTVGTGDAPIPGDPAPDIVLVTSGSIAREVARRLTPLDPRTRIACIGPGTADEARAAGLPVDVVAAERSAEALLDAVVEALDPSTPEQEGHP
ncbi:MULTISPECIES: uroporphyrinogen-III synthase [unclassified Curtobacterium]|uniref:uroporphyrinogen-III synthase n=1 Tax=unclassified Curtobacterium TaxID=257496 RepID=UPI000D9F41F1|nr:MULTISPECIES: uroporphyrinogen-III synthase [unclassified Curtobacterium]PYY37966.1 uroporphyrinogen-III synthase [Curtobacterium sp. MCBD17_029]PYY62092.1 uroporphyrinogen-III synthase [Curtobacterium sp. MCPF17_015]